MSEIMRRYYGDKAIPDSVNHQEIIKAFDQSMSMLACYQATDARITPSSLLFQQYERLKQFSTRIKRKSAHEKK